MTASVFAPHGKPGYIGVNIVLDTNIIVAATRSQRGASFKLLSLVGKGHFNIALSVPLVVEYEDVLLRCPEIVTPSDTDKLLNYLCSVAHLQEIFYLWRPFLPDAKDDFVMELAVAAGCDYIVTHNLRDFAGIHKFGIQALSPAAYLQQLGV
ncbi:MAG: putative toxin-antitoxin system toxin component, PIN family [Gammaproteobacteria bacterium]|nr:putative toxin-antitoxin system toxin component, PIN family [Gammaproteobacteria bacterium]